jgi:alkanesulfonate monooxygenase SsuD/methylene tetrahydromethanopterin reductase-like flavin-dependent oxidoreductase (luciferase family)
MTTFGYHASHEQFDPRELLACVRLAEQAGFAGASASDHFHPWSERQGSSGFVWSWLGAAMETTRLTYGTVSAPGWRYHPAILPRPAPPCRSCTRTGCGWRWAAARRSTRASPA